MKKFHAIIIAAAVIMACAGPRTSEEEIMVAPTGPYIEIRLTYNPEVYEKPSFFLPKSYPTYAVWLEQHDSNTVKTMYVTAKAGQNKWILADSRPESLPVWYGIQKKEEAEYSSNVDAVSGATQSGETAVIYWPVPSELLNTEVDVYIEANNSFDYNDYYSKNRQAEGYSGANGQPSLVWKATILLKDEDVEGIEPDIIGHGQGLGKDHQIYPDVSRITTARETFQYIGISFVANAN